MGIRAFVAPLIQDESITASLPSGESTQTHEPYFRSTKATLELIEQAVRQFHRPDEGVEILVAPRGYNCVQMLCSLDVLN